MCPTAAALNSEAFASCMKICHWQLFCTQSNTVSAKMTVLALSLFVFWILADYSDASFSFNDFTFFTDRFYRWSNFHLNPPFLSLGRMAIVVTLYGISSLGQATPVWKTSVFERKKRALHKSSFYSIAPPFWKIKEKLGIFAYFLKTPRAV